MCVLVNRLQQDNLALYVGFLPVSSIFLCIFLLLPLLVHLLPTTQHQCLESPPPHFSNESVSFFFDASGVKLICPESLWLISAEMWSFLSGSPLLLWNAGTATSKACLCKYNFMKQFALREQNKWGKIKLLRTEQCLICAPVFSKRTPTPEKKLTTQRI